ESLFVLPAHLSHVRNSDQNQPKNGIQAWWYRIQERFATGMKRVANNQYRKTLDVVLKNRGTVLTAAVCILIITISLVRFSWVKFTFMPDVEADNVIAFVEMPQGTPVEETAKVVAVLENAASQLQQEFEGTSGAVVEHMLSTIGDQPFITNSAGPGNSISVNKAGNIAEVNLQLLPAENRSATSPEIAKRWRELAGNIPGVESLSFNSSLFGLGDAINFELAGNDYDQLIEAADALKFELANYPGTFDITDSFQDGKREMKLALKPEAETLGLTLTDLARQVRQAFYGEEAQRIIRGRDEVKVMIRYPESSRKSRGDLENMRIRTPDGLEVPFNVVAKVEEGRGFSTIKRADRRRTVNVTSDVDMSIGNSSEIVQAVRADVIPGLSLTYPGISFSLEGEQAEQAETMGGIMRGFVFALLIIYVLLAIPFKSYVQPLIVMSAIPFGLIGAVGGHLLLGMNLTILSFFGIVALTGVVVNDSLVMVDFINRARERGHDAIVEAVKEAGVARFRPIILTSVTTFAGLTPLLLERSLQAQFLIPMAISLAFGVLFATAITLILVPTLYMLLEDAMEAIRGRKAEAASATA
ncbi:MAG: efflux RND transporter permease subunit, partial [Calditrichota bacterium]